MNVIYGLFVKCVIEIYIVMMSMFVIFVSLDFKNDIDSLSLLTDLDSD